MFFIQRFLLLAVGLALCQGGAISDADGQEESIQRSATFNRYFIYNLGEYSRNGYELSSNTIDEAPLTNGSYTVVIVHGHQGSAFTSLNEVMKDAFLTHDQVNNDIAFDVIVMDWSAIASQPYSNAASAVPTIAEGLVALLEELITEGLVDPTQLHLVGFGLGAHLVGIVGRLLSERPARITGLDPSGESWGANSLRLRPSDANYVEVIHTDVVGARALGTRELLGHIDIFSNAGTSQPGCANNACNHNRAWELQAASLTHPGVLIARRCSTMAEVTGNRCTGFTVEVGGTSLDKSGSGIFRVNTGRLYPYNL